MKRLAIATAALVLLVFPVRAAEDFTGKWSGLFAVAAPDGSTHDSTISLTLTHKGTTLTGTAGPTADEQWPLKGSVDGNKVTFDVQHTEMVIKFTLTYADGHLKGDASTEREGQKMAAKVDAQRTK